MAPSGYITSLVQHISIFPYCVSHEDRTLSAQPKALRTEIYLIYGYSKCMDQTRRGAKLPFWYSVCPCFVNPHSFLISYLSSLNLSATVGMIVIWSFQVILWVSSLLTYWDDSLTCSVDSLTSSSSLTNRDNSPTSSSLIISKVGRITKFMCIRDFAIQELDYCQPVSVSELIQHVSETNF